MPADRLVGRRLAIGTLHSAADAAAGERAESSSSPARPAWARPRSPPAPSPTRKGHGATAVWGTCWEGDSAPGFWPWIQVVRALAPDNGDAGQSERIRAELTGAAEERSGVLGDESAIRFRVYDLAATYLRDQSAQRPLVVVLDDLH